MTAHAERIDRDGYTILERVIEPGLVAALADDLVRLERFYGVVPSDNGFEGTKTVRIYNLLALAKLYEAIPVHANVLPVVERVLDDGCLVSSLSSIAIDAGESAQPIHADDQLIPLTKPHVPTVCNTMWALTDFTEANGATRIIPGSPSARPQPRLRCAVRQRRGRDAGRERARLARKPVARRRRQRHRRTASRHCHELLRGLDPPAGEPAARHPPQCGGRASRPACAQLCGYGVYNGLIGHIDKHSPAEMLGEPPAEGRMVWDAV